MRAYSSRSFLAPRRSGKPWKWFLLILIVGFVGGFVTATAWSVRQPVELVISTPSPPKTVAETPGDEVWSDSENISVRIPKSSTIVTSPLVVEGLERTFEQNVGVRLKDAKGIEIVKIATTGTAPDIGIYGAYRTELTFEEPKTKTGTLEVFQNSPKDGSEIDKVIVPVRFD